MYTIQGLIVRLEAMADEENDWGRDVLLQAIQELKAFEALKEIKLQYERTSKISSRKV